MANYERQILVPYLQDVCSVEMLCKKLTREIAECKRYIQKLESFTSQDVSYPDKPMETDYVLDSDTKRKSMPMYIAGAGIIGLGFLIKIPFVTIVLGAFGGILIWAGVLAAKDAANEKKKEYEDDLCWFECKVREVDEARDAINQKKQELNAELAELNHLIAELSKAEKLREDIYNVNIIPKRYRDIYAAYYLYDYFATSRETDLDRIIGTMLLDEIRKQLNDIILQNEEVVLNQRMQMAMQEQSNKQLAENHREQMKRLASMEANQELQLDYQDMITKNQAVTNFFLAADYLK